MAHQREKSTTPEKQLLNLIEDPKAAENGKIRKPFGLFSLIALKGRISFFGEKLKPNLPLAKMALDLKGINRILSLGIAGLTVYLGWSLVYSTKHLDKVPDFSQEIAKMSSEAKMMDNNFKKLDPYLEKVRSRDLFRYGGIVQAMPEEIQFEPEVLPPSAADELAKSLRLVGIGWSDDPDVMIEDTATKKVHFLKRGDWIDGKIQITGIMEDRVIMMLEGKERELR